MYSRVIFLLVFLVVAHSMDLPLSRSSRLSATPSKTLDNPDFCSLLSLVTARNTKAIINFIDSEIKEGDFKKALLKYVEEKDFRYLAVIARLGCQKDDVFDPHMQLGTRPPLTRLLVGEKFCQFRAQQAIAPGMSKIEVIANTFNILSFQMSRRMEEILSKCGTGAITFLASRFCGTSYSKAAVQEYLDKFQCDCRYGTAKETRTEYIYPIPQPFPRPQYHSHGTWASGPIISRRYMTYPLRYLLPRRQSVPIELY